ncbi:MAG: hypothetical protein CMN76_20900 [Spirochaetaceae bacterium]|nr:hypothetical protein [Spirochaetaceae bacterium]
MGLFSEYPAVRARIIRWSIGRKWVIRGSLIESEILRVKKVGQINDEREATIGIAGRRGPSTHGCPGQPYIHQ